MKAVIKRLWHWEFAKLAFFLFVLLGVALIFIATPSLFPSALISVLLFFVFSPAIDALERKGLSRTTGVLGVFLVCGLLITFGLTKMTPRISQELDSIQRGSSRFSSDISQKLKIQETELLGRYAMFKDAKLTEKLLSWVKNSTEKLWQTAPNFASQLFMCMFLVPFLTFILLKDAHEIRRQLLKLVPNRYFETVYSLMSRILDEMGGFVAARILEAALVGGLVTLMCLVLGIPYAILLGVFAGATNAIPYLGPILGAIPGLLLAILEPAAPNQLLLVTIVYLIANVIDMLVIFPLVVAKIVDLHPVAVIVSVVLGSQLFGIVGMIVAVPLTSILKILIQELYSKVYNDSEVLR